MWQMWRQSVKHRKDIEAVTKVEGYLGAHLVPQRGEHERDRAGQRAVIVMLVCLRRTIRHPTSAAS